jgi:hypothetical protein
MNINRIISESINRVITEGYSGKYAERWINNNLMPKVTRWLKGVKADKPNIDRRLCVPVYTNGYGFDKRCSMEMRGPYGYLIYVVICYFPDKVFSHGVGGGTYFPSLDRDKNIKLLLNVNKDCDISFIYRALMHEFTHIIDFIIGRRNKRPSSFGYTHQSHLFEGYNLPVCITRILYCLWDGSEFNAWQAYLKSDLDLFNEHFEQLMNFLTEANEINDEETWEELKRYLTDKVNIYCKFKTIDWVKKYFIDTSFKLLKKFTKKTEL